MKTTEENTSSVCVVCGEPEAQWSCQRKGCNNTYHLSCVRKHQPDDYITVGRWYCVDCIKKMLQFGILACDDQIESIWDVKHGRDEATYLVKYMNLAHVHNCWIPESRIRQIKPELLAKFIQEYQTNKGTTWKKEWAKPERLLLCRNLMHMEMAQTFFQTLGGQIKFYNTEWLVKWKGLGYEHATWELGTPEFIRGSEVRRLIKEYKCRQDDAARRAEYASGCNKIEKGPFVRLEAFPSGFPHGLENSDLDSLNRLRQFWHNSQNAVLIDQEERVTRIVLFIKSILDHIAQPLLILSTMISLPSWEDKIRQLIPSVHVVVHTNKSTNFLVEVTEFWGQDGQLLFQVFLSNPDAIQGFEAIKQISWEGVIVDQCDNMNMPTHLEQIKTLSAGFKMLILNKDDPSLYVKLLSVLEPGNTSLVPDCSNLKQKFSRYIAYKTETYSPTCEIIPFTGEKEVPDNKDLYEYPSSIVNPRKRKVNPNDIVNPSVFHGMMINTKRAFLECSCEELEVTLLCVQMSNLSLSSIEMDLPASTDITVYENKNLIVSAKRSNLVLALKYERRTIYLSLKPRVLRLHEMLGIPENVNSVANMFLNYVLKRHRARVVPFIILKHYLRGTLEVVLKYGTFPLNGRCEHFIHWLAVTKRYFTQHLPRLGYFNPPITITISPNANQEQVVPHESTSLEHKIEKICARRERKLHVMHRTELHELEMHEKKEARCYMSAHMSVFNNIHTVAKSKSDKNSLVLLKKIIEKFKAFQKHMACQRRMLKLMQEEVRVTEKLRKEEWLKMVKLGQMEEDDFDFSGVPLPDSGFVCEKFDWVCGGISQENVLEKLNGGLSTEALINLGSSHNGVHHDVPVGRHSTMHSINASPYKGSSSAIHDCTTQEEIEASTITDATFIMSEEIPVNVEEQLCSAEMLFEPSERETATNVINAQVLMPDIGISVLSRNFLEMPPFTQEMFPNGRNLDPHANEPTRINHRIRNITKMHEEKWEAEVQNTKRKYDALNKDADETIRNPEKILQCVEGSEMEERELGAFTAESDIPLQDVNQPSVHQNPSSQLACRSEPSHINRASSENTQAEPIETGQAPPINLLKKKKQKRVSKAARVQTDHVASPLTTNRASTPVTIVSNRDNPARLGPHIPHILNQPMQGASFQHPFSYIPYTLNPNTVQKTSTPVSPVQIPHVQYNNPSPPIWTHQPRPMSTNQVPPAVASMSYSIPNMVAPRQTHIHTLMSRSVMRNPTQPVATNWAPPVRAAYHTRPPPGPRYAFNHPYMLRAPSPYMSMRNPQPATIPDVFYNVCSFGGSVLDPNQRSGHHKS